MKKRRGAFAAAAVAAAAALSASLSGCGGASVAASAVSADTTIEMITAGQDSFYLTMECGAAVEARRLGISLTVASPAHDTPADQLPLVQGVIVGNPDALIISPATDAASSLTAAGPGGGNPLTQALYVAQENATKVVLPAGPSRRLTSARPGSPPTTATAAGSRPTASAARSAGRGPWRYSPPLAPEPRARPGSPPSAAR